MVTLLIGHRGAGKTALLERIKGYLPLATCVDLDEYIAQQEGMSVGDIFRAKGEACFRGLEEKYFRKSFADACPEQSRRAQDDRLFISVGAGFSAGFPSDVRVLWIRRETDKNGRILLDRPRLDPLLSQLESFRERFAEREERYRHLYYDVLTISEGFDLPNDEERAFFCGELRDVGGIITLLSGQRRDERWLAERLQWGVDAIELRDDLLTQEEIAWWSQRIPKERRLTRSDIHDIHDRLPGETITDVIARLELTDRDQKHLKLAIVIHSFDELWEGDRWMMANPAERSFLPRSQDGRWAWYRLLRKGTLNLNFIREGEGSAPDQPLLLDWIRTPPKAMSFAAIVGDPVAHSWTPAEQYPFFAARGMPVFRIKVTREEGERGALEVLQKLGLRSAAVTSPLKTLAYESCGQRTSVAEQFRAVNTLMWDEEQSWWRGENTDIRGLRNLLVDHNTPRPPLTLRGGDESIAVWGGGGLLPALQKILPQASFYSARSGERRAGPEIADPTVIVWATNDFTHFPPKHWRPERIIDLNYAQNSPGLDYAERQGIDYVSGMALFQQQAEEQRKFWRLDYNTPRPPLTLRGGGRFEYNHPHFKSRRQQLRNSSTEVEIALWQKLKRRRLNGLKFVRQYSVGPFILDFYCPEKRLAIELDGSQHFDPHVREYDAGRTDYLSLHDIKTIRFWNTDVTKNIESVLKKILEEASEESPS